MAFTLETDTITTQNLTSRVEVGSYTAAADGLILVDILLTGLAASAATITVDAVINRASTDRQGAFFADTKFAAGNTSWIRPGAFAIPVLSGDVVKVGVKSSNASDTSISGSVIFRDGLQASALTGHTPQSGDSFAVVTDEGFGLEEMKAYIDAIYVDTGTAIPASISALPSASTIAAAVWGAGTRTLSSFGTLATDAAAAVWAAVARTLTSGGGLTAQQVRDAMMLAPTAGTPDAGSVDKHLDDIESKTATIGASTASTEDSVVAGDDIEIVAYDSYTTASGRPKRFTIEDYAGPAVDGLTAKFGLVALADYEADADFDPSLEIEGTASLSGTTLTLSFEITSAQTGALAATEPPGERFSHVYQVLAEDGDGQRISHSIGSARVRRNVIQ